MDRGREFIGRFNGLPDVVTDLTSSRAFLRAYAEKEAADTGRICGIRYRGTPVGAVICAGWTCRRAPPRRAAGWSLRRWAGGW